MKTTLISIFIMLMIVPPHFGQDVPNITLEGRTGATGHDGAVTFSPDGSTLASVGEGGTIRLWEVATGRLIKTLTGHIGGIEGIYFSPHRDTLASSGMDGTVRLWDTATGRHKRLTGHTEQVFGMAFSPDGNMLACGSWTDIYLWDVATGRLIKALNGHTAGVTNVAFSPDGGTLASGGGWDDRTVRLWDVATGVNRKTLTGHWGGVTSIAFSPDGDMVASGGGWGGGTVRLWDAITGQFIKLLAPGGDVIALSFHPDAETLAVGCADSNIYLLDIASGQKIKTLTGHKNTVIGSVAFSPNGGLLASADSDSIVRLWTVTIPTTQVRITPSPTVSPKVGQRLTLNLSIVEGKNVGGYQGAVTFDATALRYVASARGDYLPAGFFVPPVVEGNRILFGASTLNGVSHGDGTLASLTFEVVNVKASTVALSDVVLTDGVGEPIAHLSFGGFVVASLFPEDVNQDGVVNIQDLVLVSSNFGQQVRGEKIDVNRDGIVNVVDLVKVAAALGAGAAPSAMPLELEFGPTSTAVRMWLEEARRLNLTDATSQRGIRFLEQLLEALLTPKETALLPNYPNPFNPETWIPYQLAKPVNVSMTIYAANGGVVRTLALGHQPAGIYDSRSRAAYWDRRNELDERVASGVYFYTLTAGEFRATRKMLIVK